MLPSHRNQVICIVSQLIGFYIRTLFLNGLSLWFYFYVWPWVNLLGRFMYAFKTEIWKHAFIAHKNLKVESRKLNSCKPEIWPDIRRQDFTKTFLWIWSLGTPIFYNPIHYLHEKFRSHRKSRFSKWTIIPLMRMFSDVLPLFHSR